MPEETRGDSSAGLDQRANVLKSPLAVEYMTYKVGDALLPGAIQRIREVDHFLSGKIASELGAEEGPVTSLLKDQEFTGHVIAVGREGNQINSVAVISNPREFKKIDDPSSRQGVLAFRELTISGDGDEQNSRTEQFLIQVFDRLPTFIAPAVGNMDPARLEALRIPTVYLQSDDRKIIQTAINTATAARGISQSHVGSEICKEDRRLGIGPTSDENGNDNGLEIWAMEIAGPDNKLRTELGGDVSATWINQRVAQVLDPNPEKTISNVHDALESLQLPREDGDYARLTADQMRKAEVLARSTAFGNKNVQATNDEGDVSRLLNDGPVALLQRDTIRIAFQLGEKPQPSAQ